MAEECAQFGWTALAKMLGKSKRTLMRQKKDRRGNVSRETMRFPFFLTNPKCRNMEMLV